MVGLDGSQCKGMKRLVLFDKAHPSFASVLQGPSVPGVSACPLHSPIANT